MPDQTPGPFLRGHDGDEVFQFPSGIRGIENGGGDFGADEFAEADAQSVNGDFQRGF